MKSAFSSFAAVILVGAMAAAAIAQTSKGISQGEHYEPGFPNAAPVGRFDNGYLDHHPKVAQQLSHNPGLVDNPQFLATHPGLDSYLATHPQVRTELQQHPERFMNAERRYEAHENENGSGFPNAAPVGRFDNGYLDHHPEVAQQLSHNPGLVDNPQFLATHPGLDSYLATHPQVRTELQQHPERFMNAERRYEAHENENGSGFPNAAPVGRFDNGYLDHHPEVAQQLSHNPGLVDNPQFLATHPGLDSYLATHPQVRTELQRHPERFMNAERRYEAHENENGPGFPNAAPVGRFDNGYLDHHPEVAQQLSHNPGMVDNPQFLATHPGLDSYLATHPQVRTELQQHPERFMNAERRYEGYENRVRASDSRRSQPPIKFVRRANNHPVR